MVLISINGKNTKYRSIDLLFSVEAVLRNSGFDFQLPRQHYSSWITLHLSRLEMFILSA